MLRDAVSSTVLHFDLHGVWVPAFAGTTVDRFAQSITNLNAQFSEHSSRRDKTLFASLAIEEERRCHGTPGFSENRAGRCCGCCGNGRQRSGRAAFTASAGPG